MKKAKIFITSIISATLVLAVALGVLLIIIDKEGAPENNAKLFDSYYIYRSNSMHCEIYNKSKQDSFDSDKQICSGWIYKYAFDADKKFIAFRNIAYEDSDGDRLNDNGFAIYNRYYGGKEYAVTQDILMLYDCVNKRFTDFKDDKSLSEYCRRNGINLCNWYYPAGNGFFREERTHLTDNCYIKSWLFGYSSVMLSGKEVAFGFISDVKKSDNSVTFRLRQTKNVYTPEQANANKGLSPLSDKPIGKYKTGFLEYEQIYYDKVIRIDTVTGEITESNSK